MVIFTNFAYGMLRAPEAQHYLFILLLAFAFVYFAYTMAAIPNDPAVLPLDAPPAAGVRMLTLIGTDGHSVEIDAAYVCVSPLLQEKADADEKGSIQVSIAGPILELMVEYLNHHKGVPGPIPPKPLKSKSMQACCEDPWDAEFIDRVGEDTSVLRDLTMAANLCGIRSLVHLACAKATSLIKWRVTTNWHPCHVQHETFTVDGEDYLVVYSLYHRTKDDQECGHDECAQTKKFVVSTFFTEGEEEEPQLSTTT